MPERLASRQLERFSLKSRLRNMTLVAIMASSPAGGPGLTFPAPIKETPPISSHELYEEALERQVEDRFNITILNKREYSELTGFDPSDGRYYPGKGSKKEIDWSAKRINLITKVLPLLPKSFYGPDGEGNKLMLVLDPSKEINAACSCNYDGDSDNSVHLNRGNFISEDINDLLNIVAHELAHRKQPWGTSKSDPLYYEDYSSPWVLRRDEILGINNLNFNLDPSSNRHEFARKIIRKVYELRPEAVGGYLIDKLWEKGNGRTEEEEKVFFAHRMLYSVAYSPGGWDPRRFDAEFLLYWQKCILKDKNTFLRCMEIILSQSK